MKLNKNQQKQTSETWAFSAILPRKLHPDFSPLSPAAAENARGSGSGTSRGQIPPYKLVEKRRDVYLKASENNNSSILTSEPQQSSPQSTAAGWPFGPADS